MKRVIQSALGIAVSALAVYLTFHGKDLGAIWRAVQAGDYRYLPVYLASLGVIHLLRTVRWGILLEPVAKVPFARLNAVSAVGFTALLVLPFRLGEFARPYLIAERPRLRVSAALSSVVVERVADGIFTAILLLVTLFAVPEGTPHLGEIRKAGYVMAALFGGLLTFLIVAYRSRELAVRFMAGLLRPVSPRLAERAGGMLDAFIRGLRLVPSKRKLGLFVGLTAAYWALNGWGMLLMAQAFNLDIQLIDAFTILGVLVAGIMIPAGPGMVGTFQLATVFGLSLFVPEEVAHTRGVAWANVLWASQVGFQLLLGAVFIFSPHIQASRIFKSPEGTAEALDVEEAEALEADRRDQPPGTRVPPAGA
jgi:glycosyltransferase 2 family protein